MSNSPHLRLIVALIVVLGVHIIAQPVTAQDPLPLDATATIVDTDDDAITVASFSYPSTWSVGYTYGSVRDNTATFNIDTPEGFSVDASVVYQGQLVTYGYAVPSGEPPVLADAVTAMKNVLAQARDLQNATIDAPNLQSINGREYAEIIFTQASADTTTYYALGIGRVSADYVVVVVAEWQTPTAERPTFDQLNATTKAIAGSIALNDSIFTAPELAVFDPALGGNTDVASTDGFASLMPDDLSAFEISGPSDWTFAYGDVEFLGIQSAAGYDLDVSVGDLADIAAFNVSTETSETIISGAGGLLAASFAPSSEGRFESGTLSFDFANGEYAELIYSSLDRYPDDTAAADARNFMAFGVLTLDNGTTFFINIDMIAVDLDAFLAQHTIARAIISTLDYEPISFDTTGYAVLTPENAANIGVVGNLAEGGLYDGTFGFVGDSNTIVLVESSDFIVLDVATGQRTFVTPVDLMWQARRVFPISDSQVLFWTDHDNSDGLVVELWDIAAQQRRYQRQFLIENYPIPVAGAATLLADRTQLVFVGDAAATTLVTIDVATGETLHTAAVQWESDDPTTSPPTIGALTAIDERLLLCTQTVTADVLPLLEVDPATGDIRNRYQPFALNASCSTLQASPSGQVVIWTGFVGSDETVAFLDANNDFGLIATYVVTSLNENTLPVFSPDGTLAAIATESDLMIFEAATGQLLTSVAYSDALGSAQDSVYIDYASAHFSPDGTLIGLMTDEYPLFFFGIAQ